MNKIKTISFTMSLFVAIVSLLTTFVYVQVLYPLKYKQEIETAGYVNHVAPELLASLINEESSFDNLCESRAGAIGLMQLMPATAQWLASKMQVDFSVAKLYEPQYNINMGAYYLRYLLDRFGDEYTALCAYNAGEGQVKAWLLSKTYSSGDKVLNTTPYKETNAYVEKVLKNKARYSTRFEINFRKS